MKKQLIAISLLLAGVLSACSPKSESTPPPSASFVGIWKLDRETGTNFTGADGSQAVDNLPVAGGFLLLNIQSDFTVSMTSSDLESTETEFTKNIGRLQIIDDSSALLIMNPEFTQSSTDPVTLKIKSDAVLTVVTNKMEMNLSKLNENTAKDLIQSSNEYRQFAQSQKGALATRFGGKKFILAEKKTQYSFDGKESSWSEDIGKLEDEHKYSDYISVNAKRIAFSENLSEVIINEKWNDKVLISSLKDKSGVIMSFERSLGKDTTTFDLRGKISLTADGFTVTSDSTYTDKDRHVYRTISTSKYILVK